MAEYSADMKDLALLGYFYLPLTITTTIFGLAPRALPAFSSEAFHFRVYYIGIGWSYHPYTQVLPTV
jgi:hypothetical protein